MFAKITLGVGIAIAVALFLFINETNLLGMSCYHVGQFSPQSLCLKPTFYRGVWLFVLILIAFGAWRVFRAKNKVRAPQ